MNKKAVRAVENQALWIKSWMRWKFSKSGRKWSMLANRRWNTISAHRVSWILSVLRKKIRLQMAGSWPVLGVSWYRCFIYCKLGSGCGTVVDCSHCNRGVVGLNPSLCRLFLLLLSLVMCTLTGPSRRYSITLFPLNNEWCAALGKTSLMSTVGY